MELLIAQCLVLGFSGGLLFSLCFCYSAADAKELAAHRADEPANERRYDWIMAFDDGQTARDNGVPYRSNPYSPDDEGYSHDGWKTGWRYWEYILNGDKVAEDDVEFTKRYPYGGNTPYVHDVPAYAAGKSRLMRECCGGECHEISPAKADPVDFAGVLEPSDALDEELSEDGPTLLSMPQCCSNKCSDGECSEVIFEEGLEERNVIGEEVKSMFKEHDVVRIKVSDPGRGIVAGSLGTVVHVYDDGDCEVEYVMSNGIPDIATMEPSELEVV